MPRERPQYLLCIDPGVRNMGLALVAVSAGEFLLQAASCTDITIFPCTGTKCSLRHEAMMTDWVLHFIQANQKLFDAADVILLERQPPCGFRCCEQLLFSQFRDKVQLIHPRSLHCFFSMSKLSYDGRKLHSVRLGERYYRRNDILATALQKTRAHDICDAMLMAVYYTKTRAQKAVRDVTLDVETANFFDQFYYNKG